jgi:hypothetical protein
MRYSRVIATHAVLATCCFTFRARADASQPPVAVRTELSPAEDYARRSFSLLGGLNFSHQADYTYAGAYGGIGAWAETRFVTRGEFVIQPMLAWSHDDESQVVLQFPFRPYIAQQHSRDEFDLGLGIGWSHAISSGVALTLLGGCRGGISVDRDNITRVQLGFVNIFFVRAGLTV